MNIRAKINKTENRNYREKSLNKNQALRKNQ